MMMMMVVVVVVERGAFEISMPSSTVLHETLEIVVTGLGRSWPSAG
jgi:hypothetical protein